MVLFESDYSRQSPNSLWFNIADTGRFNLISKNNFVVALLGDGFWVCLYNKESFWDPHDLLFDVSLAQSSRLSERTLTYIRRHMPSSLSNQGWGLQVSRYSRALAYLLMMIK